MVALGGAQRAKHTKQLLSRLARIDALPPLDAAGRSAVGKDSAGGKKKGGSFGKDAGRGLDGGGTAAADGSAAVVAGLAAQLEEEVGCEDPYNGELTVRLLDAPYIDPTADSAEIVAWQV